LTDTVGWRWCFWINLPLGAITIAGIAFVMKTPENLENTKTWKEKLREIDYIGPSLFMPACTSLLLALQWGGALYAWNSPAIIGLFCAFGALIPIWIWSQIKQGERATIPIRLITQRTVLFSSVYSFFFGAFQVLCFYIPLYFQAVKGSSATESGIQSLPLILAATVAAVIGGILISIIGYIPPFMIGGAAIMTVGVGLFSTFDVDTSTAIWIGYQIIAGSGSGLNLQVIYLYSIDAD
jgi:nitrate/nitrite transporter NarK